MAGPQRVYRPLRNSRSAKQHMRKSHQTKAQAEYKTYCQEMLFPHANACNNSNTALIGLKAEAMPKFKISSYLKQCRFASNLWILIKRASEQRIYISSALNCSQVRPCLIDYILIWQVLENNMSFRKS